MKDENEELKWGVRAVGFHIHAGWQTHDNGRRNVTRFI
jgi:hypothetical protein